MCYRRSLRGVEEWQGSSLARRVASRTLKQGVNNKTPINGVHSTTTCMSGPRLVQIHINNALIWVCCIGNHQDTVAHHSIQDHTRQPRFFPNPRLVSLPVRAVLVRLQVASRSINKCMYHMAVTSRTLGTAQFVASMNSTPE